ncbi:DEAD/DEAH box helicase, partial [Candidatus Sumerlaeota bacterium]|nr:DEAD/DEAH box helicase [Candidatus Sumerlaeota bacterium]
MIQKNSWTLALLRHIRNDYRHNAIYKGKNYALNHRVLKLYLNRDNYLASLVQGTKRKPYTTCLWMSRGDIEAYCSCPVGVYCKHAYATALTALYGILLSGGNLSKAEIALLPQAWLKQVSPPAPELFREVRILWEDPEQADEIVTRKGASPEWWRLFLETSEKNKKREILATAMENRLINPRTRFSRWEISNLISDLMEMPDPFDILRAYESSVQKAAGYLYTRLRPPDPRLIEFLDSNEALEMKARIEEQEGLRVFLNWLQETKRQPVGTSNRIEVSWLSQKDSWGIPVLSYQVRLTSSRMNNLPRSSEAVKLMDKNIQRGERDFSSRDSSFIHWLAERNETYHDSRSHPRRDDDAYAYPVSDALEWLNLWGYRQILHWREGGLVKFDARPARLSVSRAPSGSLEWVVVFPGEKTDDLRIVPLRDLECMGEKVPSYFSGNAYKYAFIRRDDILYRLDTGEMEAFTFFRIRNLRNLPFETIRGSLAGANLVEKLQLSRDSWCQDFAIQYAAAQPIVEFRLQEGYDVSIVCRARTSEGREFFRNARGEWILFSPPKKVMEKGDDPLEEIPLFLPEDNRNAKQEAQTAEEKDVSPQALAILPRPEDVGALESWIGSLIPRDAVHDADKEGRSFTQWKLSRKEMELLVRLWENRPPDVIWLGNRKFKNLITPRSLPRWNIKIHPSGVNWLSVSLEMEKEVEGITHEDIEQILKQENEEMILLPNKGVYRKKDILEFKKNLDVLNNLGLEPDAGFQRLHALQLGGESGKDLMALAGRDEAFHKLAENAQKMFEAFQGIPPCHLDEKTRSRLRPYQHYGVDFISWACVTFGGAILADDMGLGKTLQALAMLNALRSKEKQPPPSLVLCPASVVHNWQREASHFAPNLRIGVIESGARRQRIYKHLNEYDLIITNYALARKDREFLSTRKWFLVCVDEAQAIKNPQAATSRVVKDIMSDYRLALTGTPVENRILDLWSIMDFVIPGFLPAHSAFEKKWRESDNEAFYRILRARLRPILLRRLKSDVAPELPPRIEERRDCEMTPKQKKVYLAELRKTRLMLESAQTKRIAGKERIQILAALTRLRQICCDPAIIGIKGTDSGKTSVLLELVNEILASGQKILVFSQFVRMLERIKTHLESAGIPFYMLTGKTVKRKELIERFENDFTPSVFLISLKAGGLGLNLVSASHVILFDPWWNPAVEAQAIDRTHRIGQKKTVVAFRLVTQGAIEERILELQEKKRKLVRNILEEEAFNRTLT